MDGLKTLWQNIKEVDLKQMKSIFEQMIEAKPPYVQEWIDTFLHYLNFAFCLFIAFAFIQLIILLCKKQFLKTVYCAIPILASVAIIFYIGSI